MKTSKIIKSLEKYSPHGLCDGTLCKKEGAANRFVGCAMGCLAADFIRTPAGRKVAKEIDLSLHEGIPTSNITNSRFGDTLKSEYGLNDGEMDRIISFNDNCNGENADTFMADSLPRNLRRTIKRLRTKYDTYIESLPTA